MAKKANMKTPQQAAREEKARARLLAASDVSESEALRDFAVTYEGQNEQTAEVLREQYGENSITRAKADGTLKRLLNAFTDPFALVLLGIALVSFFTDVVLAAPGEAEPWSVIIVLIMVAIAGGLQFVQESRSNSAAEALTEMVETTIAVYRKDRGLTELPIDEIVTGDIVKLVAGDMIPADMRILQAKDLFVAQSSLTGESEAVEKFGELEIGGATSANPLDRRNLAFMGSNVVSGAALGLVVNVGDDTIFGGIAQSLTEKPPETGFEKGISSVSWLLIRFMFIMVPIVFILSGLNSGSWLEALLFAISVAVGLTPAMLPTIVSAGLAKGATTLSKQEVIVKDLGSIQNFGAIDVLCTDKTGTITQDKVVLLHSLDVHGNENERILRHAFLNSYYQTGLTNLMDKAIVEYAGKYESANWKKYHKLDELPFDFSRRRMSVVVEDEKGVTQLITKGAIEEMLAVSSHVEYGGERLVLDDALRSEVLARVEEYNGEGLRVLGIAQRLDPPAPFTVEDESGMTLMGFLAFLDPPKESTAAAIRALNDHGVAVKILTGDNDAVTRAVCAQVGMKVEKILLGADLEDLSDTQLDTLAERIDVFAKLTPQQKVRVVASLRRLGHTVGFMGDGINDAAAMKQADVGISVDTAVDIAKESANVILLQKDLMVLEKGLLEGRKTYANIIKYIKMTVSSNFGNMFSVLAASAFLPFLPMLGIQILVLNLIYDISCIAIPWDNVDAEFLRLPRKWEAASIKRFMFWFGPTSSIFDISTYLLLFFVLCPAIVGGAFGALDASKQVLFATLFQTGWFIESLWTQTLVIHLIRTPKVPFVQSRASWKVTASSLCAIAVGTVLPYTQVGKWLDMAALPPVYYLLLLGTVAAYILLVTVVKKLYVARYGELL